MSIARSMRSEPALAAWSAEDLPATGQTTTYQPGVQGQILAIELTQ